MAPLPRERAPFALVHGLSAAIRAIAVVAGVAAGGLAGVLALYRAEKGTASRRTSTGRCTSRARRAGMDAGAEAVAALVLFAAGTALSMAAVSAA